MNTRPRVNLYKTYVDNLKPKNKPYFVCDSEVVGLRAVVQVTGIITWYLQRYNKAKKYSQRYKIGNYPECSVAAARQIAKQVKAKAVQGQDPAVTLKDTEKEKTFGELMSEFVKKKYNRYSTTKAKSTTYSARVSIDAWVYGKTDDPKILKIWKHNKEALNIKRLGLSKITHETIVDFHQAVSQKTEYNANRLVGYIREAFNYAKVKQYFFKDNPASFEKKDLNTEIKDHYDYFKPSLVPDIVAAFDKEGKQYRNKVACAGLKAALLCGGRYQTEVFNLTVNQIDLENKTISYKNSKGGQDVRPINDDMVKHLQWVIDQRTAGKKPFYYPPEDMRHRYLFPNYKFGSNIRTKRGIKPIKLKHIKCCKNLWKEICRKYKFEKRDLKSLRHTFAVYMIHLGVSIRALQKMMLHKSIETTEIYAAIAPETVTKEMKKVSFKAA